MKLNLNEDRYSKEFQDLLKKPKEGYKYMSSEGVQAQFAVDIGSRLAMNGEAIYEWAKKHGVNLSMGAYYLSNPSKFDLLGAVLNDTIKVKGYDMLKNDKHQKNLKENILKKYIIKEDIKINNNIEIKKGQIIYIQEALYTYDTGSKSNHPLMLNIGDKVYIPKFYNDEIFYIVGEDGKDWWRVSRDPKDKKGRTVRKFDVVAFNQYPIKEATDQENQDILDQKQVINQLKGDILQAKEDGDKDLEDSLKADLNSENEKLKSMQDAIKESKVIKEKFDVKLKDYFRSIENKLNGYKFGYFDKGVYVFQKKDNGKYLTIYLSQENIDEGDLEYMAQHDLSLSNIEVKKVQKSYKESKLKEGAPQKFKNLSDKDIVNLIKDAVSMPLRQLRKNQDLIQKQMQSAYDQRNEDALINLSVMDEVYRVAIDIKEFGDSEPKEYIVGIKDIIRQYK